jgi:hypothetical protein
MNLASKHYDTISSQFRLLKVFFPLLLLTTVVV